MDIAVSIIIVNYNTEILLKDCLSSVIDKTTDIKYEIIVVDNDSRKGSLDSLIDLFPDVRFKLLSKNLGFGMANNIAAELAQGKYLFFLNPDTILVNNAIKLFFDYMEVNPDVAICGGNLLKEDLTPASSFYNIDFMLFEYKIIFNIKRLVGFNYTDQIKNIRVIVGADFFIRKDIFVQLKGFDPMFFMYFEEVELCDRVRSLNKKIVSIPQAQIIHLQGQSAENKNDELGKWSYQEHWYSMWIYFYKTKGQLLTSLLYNTHMLKLNLAKKIYTIKNNADKITYWQLKENIIKKTYQRYKNTISNK